MVTKANRRDKIAENVWQRVGGREGGTVATFGASGGSAAHRRIWAGTMAGVFTSDDNGHTWTISNTGLASPYVQFIAVSPNYERDKSLLSAASQVGAFSTIDGGKHWTRLGFWGVVPDVTCIAYSPTYATDRTAFIGSDDEGVFRTVNAGRTWNSTSALGGTY